jgi:transcriptional regulator with XRE-family HTH domain
MNNRVVSIYFRELREGQGFTQESLAEAAHCGKRTIERLERNEGPIGLVPLERIMSTLGASRDEVNYLMTNPSASEADAREMARALLRRDPSQHWPAVHLSTVAPDADQLGVQTYVRTLRERQGLSRKEVADRLGVLIATYADWESGQSTAMAFPVLARLIRYVGGSLDDLQRIALAPEGHEALGLQLAQERLAILTPPQHASHAAQNGAASHIPDGHSLLRLSIIEGLLHFILSLLQRALPSYAEEIAHTATYWFKLSTADEDVFVNRKVALRRFW